MVAKCANPKCDSVFKYSSEGRLFVVEDLAKRASSPLFESVYWLCNRCASEFQVRSEKGGELQLVSRAAAA